MTHCKLTAREFIVNTFAPQIGAVCSDNVETMCQKNNLSFVELLQPFCRLNSEGYLKDPQGNSIVVRSLQIAVRNINISPPETAIARKMLNETVSLSFTDRTAAINTGRFQLEIPTSVPWFELWRDVFLRVQYPSDHEFTKHFLACMIVTSTSDDDPLDAIQRMTGKLNQSVPGKFPKWFNNNVLRYYILVHDTHQDNKQKSEEVFENMKNMFGSNNCFLLQMNSRLDTKCNDNQDDDDNNDDNDSSYLPDPWSQFIIKNVNISDESEQNSSSPRTPAENFEVSMMPNQVDLGNEKTGHLKVIRVTPQSPESPNRNFTDTISVSSEEGAFESAVPIGGVVQDTVSEIKIHPLSPSSEHKEALIVEDSTSYQEISPINANVWAHTPGNSVMTVVQHGMRLSSDDLERLRTMVSEFCLKSLLPYVEKQIGLLNDFISNKKGVSRSLFSATKRWFGTSKPGVPGTSSSNLVIYTAESPELQLRRLGDLCFMFGHYSYAYQAYYNAKRDFAADQAWLYYAGALEMAALSAFMQNEMTKKTVEYMDDAISTYLNTCKMPQFATRATLLSVECLKNQGLNAEAAKQLIRMTSEDSDLRSALLLEQAAYCFIEPKMIRKYAFHIVIAGYRFSKAGQKKHSSRCYQQAYQIYQGKGWSFAEDHIHFTLGRQAISLKQTESAVKYFEKLLNSNSRQPAIQQASFLREFIQMKNILLLESTVEENKKLLELPLPIIDGNKIKVLPGPLLKSTSNSELTSEILSFLQESDVTNTTFNTQWSHLEERVVTKAQGSSPMIFKPKILIYSDLSDNSSSPSVVVDEPIYFLIELFNPLNVVLKLSQLNLLWFLESEGKSFTNEMMLDATAESFTQIMETQTIDNILLLPSSKQNIVMHLKPKVIGYMKVLGISYKLWSNTSDGTLAESEQFSNSNGNFFVRGKKNFQIRGQKLKKVKEKAGAILYGKDYRLEMNIVPRAPFMEVSTCEISREMICGEIQKVALTLRNIGNARLTNAYVSLTNPELITFADYEIISDDECKINSEKTRLKSDILVMKIPLVELDIQESYKTAFWIWAPPRKGNHRLDLLFYYDNPELKKTSLKYRVSRHSWQLTILDSLQIDVIARRSAVVSNDRNPTLNLSVRMKNMNQRDERQQSSFIKEMQLIDFSLQSKEWTLIHCITPINLKKIQSQETSHILLKVMRRNISGGLNDKILERETKFSSISLLKNDDDDDDDDDDDGVDIVEAVTKSPFIDFLEKNKMALDVSENIDDEEQQQQQQQQEKNSVEDNTLSVVMNLNSILIIRWRAKIMKEGVVVRKIVGQQQVEIQALNKYYNNQLPNEFEQELIGYGTNLKIFGPDSNADSRFHPSSINKYSHIDCQKNVLWYSLNHVRQKRHNFKESKICTIPVIMIMHNNSYSRINVRINTIGTSSQTQLPSIKSRMYSPQASHLYRYAGHTAVECNIEPFGFHTLKLQAIIPTSGTYDLASRIDVSVRFTSWLGGDFMPQKWHIESICIVSNEMNC